MKGLKELIGIALLAISVLNVAWAEGGSADTKVGITANIPFVDVLHHGVNVRVKRIDDVDNKLVDDFTKTSRPCPPFCIQPMSAAPGVKTYGELELLHFLMGKVKEGKGVLVDARMPDWFVSETIPGSINLPFVIVKKDNPNMPKILTVLGAKQTTDGSFDFSGAKELVLYCNGPWCEQSPRAIHGLISLGYPASKLKYYRGGVQAWKSLGLTTVVSKKKGTKS